PDRYWPPTLTVRPGADTDRDQAQATGPAAPVRAPFHRLSGYRRVPCAPRRPCRPPPDAIGPTPHAPALLAPGPAPLRDDPAARARLARARHAARRPSCAASLRDRWGRGRCRC